VCDPGGAQGSPLTAAGDADAMAMPQMHCCQPCGCACNPQVSARDSSTSLVHRVAVVLALLQGALDELNSTRERVESAEGELGLTRSENELLKREVDKMRRWVATAGRLGGRYSPCSTRLGSREVQAALLVGVLWCGYTAVPYQSIRSMESQATDPSYCADLFPCLTPVQPVACCPAPDGPLPGISQHEEVRGRVCRAVPQLMSQPAVAKQAPGTESSCTTARARP
jgi:hypothetical protein